MSKSIPGTLVLICTISLMGLARADDRSPFEICRDMSSPAAFAGCTAAIDSNEVYGLALANVYGNRALLYLARHDLAHALADSNEAVKIDITSAPYRRTRALIFWLSGKDEEAANDAEEAIWLDTSVALPYVIRGRVKAKQSQFLPAIEDFTHALQLTPGDADVLFERGAAYMQVQQWQLALADEDLVLQQKPNFAVAWFVRALAKRALGDIPGSDADFDAATKLNPNLKKPDLSPKAPG